MGNREIIAQLKAAKREQGLSFQQIVDKCVEIGKPVSIATVKRVFSSGSEQYEFRYETTIQPLALVLLGRDPSQDSAERITELAAEVAELKAQVADLEQSAREKDVEIAHKARMEWVLSLVSGCLAVVLVVFYVSHALMGW